MTLEDLLERWDRDSNFSGDIGDDLRKIPSLHNTYFTLLMKARRSISEVEDDLDKVSFVKHLYYSGKAPPSAYKEAPLGLQILKSDLPMWVRSDEAVARVSGKIKKFKLFEKALVEIVTQINDRKWIIRSMIDWQKLTMGDN